jgi:Bifunctional DNA primase/polymerase, N-terminal
MASNSGENLAAALEVAAMGLRVFPANAATKSPCIKGWQEQATTDRSAIDQLWRLHPNAVPAILAGGSDLLVVDLDVKGGKNGNWEWDAICNENGFEWSACPIVKTTTGGHHIYFEQPAHPRIGCSVGTISAGIDLRGDGGLVIAPGAILHNGLRYECIRGILRSIPTIPDNIRDFFLGKALARSRTTSLVVGNEARSGGQDGGSATPRDFAYASSALLRIAAELAARLPGSGRNNALNASAYRWGASLAPAGSRVTLSRKLSARQASKTAI